jgi:hypothetical protein
MGPPGCTLLEASRSFNRGGSANACYKAPVPSATADVADAVRWLRISYWTGAVTDAIAALQMLVPSLFAFGNGLRDFAPGRDYRFAMGMGASLMIGWTALLIWADRRPVERRDVLLITIVPVIAGLALNELVAVRNGFLPTWSVVPVWLLQVALTVLFWTSYRRAASVAA